MGLIDKALQICQNNYKTNCGRCPIRTAYIAPMGPRKEALVRWRDNINAAIEKLAQ
ncbi:hypothetical protein JOD82_002045 [Paenibacillus sp. 1182]|uniref:hypothetical protein n=1 Tax=Paenibacillus sp. 1182 TaxID=2806565 RepID=UPI001AEB7301|nr:hypothetical protein [Paenibacillus sp. 1182]MBP1309025.1 hypothetical protein [Paenibacillus sp. 1182]